MKRKSDNYDRRNAKQQPITFKVGRLIKRILDEKEHSYGKTEAMLNLSTNSLSRLVAMNASHGCVKVNLDDLDNFAAYFGYQSASHFISEALKEE